MVMVSALITMVQIIIAAATTAVKMASIGMLVRADV
jgi:hypothetical protein